MYYSAHSCNLQISIILYRYKSVHSCVTQCVKMCAIKVISLQLDKVKETDLFHDTGAYYCTNCIPLVPLSILA